MVAEKTTFDFPLEMGGDTIPEINMVVGGFSLFTCPSAMGPGTHHNGVFRLWIPGLDALVDIQGAVQIFCIKPAAHRHNGVVDSFQVRQDIAFLPEFVVVGV